MIFTQMGSSEKEGRCHVVAMPYPGRGHINPMLNLCKLISNKRPNFLITFIVTEEWLGFLKSESRPDNFHFVTIPNCIPSEIGRGADFAGFLEATLTKLEAPVEQLIDRLHTPPSVIVYDTNMFWVVGLGNRMSIPVASFWTMPARVFSMFHHYDLLVQNGHLPANSPEKGELVDYIPGVPSTRVRDLPTPFYGKGNAVLHRTLEAMSWVPKCQYILFTDVYELDAGVIDALKSEFSMPIYTVGPAIPYLNLSSTPESQSPVPDYMKWLDCQPRSSVLYISQGSFLSVSSDQLDAIVTGVRDSGVAYFWVARNEASRLASADGTGLVVPWCDQLKVLCHPAIGGFWSHCGWNSTKEAAFAGLPVLTLPIFWDQAPTCKMIVEDWKIGLRVMEDDQRFVTAEEIASLVRRFMDLDSAEGKEMRRRAKEIQAICRQATAKGGSLEIDIDAFISDLEQVQTDREL